MGHRNPSSAQTSHANAVAMNEVKGKPRSEGYPVSNRTQEFKAGQEFPTAWATPGKDGRATTGQLLLGPGRRG